MSVMPEAMRLEDCRVMLRINNNSKSNSGTCETIS